MRLKNGITLVEVVVAAFILVIAFIPIYRLMSHSATVSVKVGNAAKAADLMAKFMEEVKHTPLKLYEEKMSINGANEYTITIPEEFYADTTKAIEELKKEEDKEFWIEKTEAKAKVNKYKQIVEMCVSCQINWKEKGNRDASSQRDQFLRDYGLIFNAEAKLN